ncbi:glycosyl transferase [Saccharopolyspora sp. K220]|uniref:macrolide family glycosyltransferase n=1 Tax=Saccharopolyspora soli TaxID=2926618 RepID=UPI001F584A64|nr:macrolide family glycosyltransferase [Saccharopolyspora soli]MCI2416811.1 glycosyl transferase [Saccharopolyspora soli]
MSRIVLTGMPAAGHLNPSLPLVRELVRRRVEVTYYTSDEFRDQVEHTGAEFRPYPAGTIAAEDIAEATRTGSPVRVVTRVLTATETLLPFLLTELRAQQPAAVAFDSNAIWGRMAAVSLGLPTISFMTTMMLGGASMKSLTAREWVHFIRTAMPDVPGAIAAKRQVLRRFDKQIFPPRPTFPMRGDVTLFPIPRWLQPPDPRIDERCHYIGPTIEQDTRNRDLDAELAAHLDTLEPLVLVSLGTLHAGSDAFFRSCFEVFADLPARFLLSVGSHTDPARLGQPPTNTLVRASVPQLDVLRRTAVFVTHGGMNSVLEGLAYGVPLVVIPQQFEQLVIGQAVADRGAGAVLRQNLSNRPVPPAELRAAVERALTDSDQRTAAKTISETLYQGGGAAAGAEAIQSLLTSKL